MSETVVYRDPLGYPNDELACVFESDIEIVKKSGPETRQRSRERLTGNVYRMVIWFSHNKNTIVKRFELNDPQVKALQVLASHYDDDDNFTGRATNMVFKCYPKNGAVIFAEGYGTHLSSRGLLKLLCAIRVKDFLDRYERMEAILPGFNRKLTMDCMMASAMYVARFAASYILHPPPPPGSDPLLESDPREMEHKDYTTVVTLLAEDPDYADAFRHDSTRLYKKVKELLGLEYEMHPKVFNQLLNYLGSSLNVYNENMSNWRDEDLFVRGVWNLHFT